jgi:anaerobic selenocysteine-containing dehydrogenase
LAGGPVDLERKPTADEILDSITTYARVPLAEIKQHAGGAVFDDQPAHVEAGNAESKGRMHLLPEPIADELDALLDAPSVDGAGFEPGETFTHRLISRRLREVFNSMGHELPAVRAKRTYNPAFMSPTDLHAMGIRSGALIEISSGHGQIVGVAEAAEDVPSGVISMAHSWGDLPKHDEAVREIGSCTSRLIDNARHYDPISGMARQSAIPVNVRPA